MRRLVNQNPRDLEYWQCIAPATLAKYINEHPPVEGLYYFAKLVAEGTMREMDSEKQFRYARYTEATMSYLEKTQLESDVESMDMFYTPFIYMACKCIPELPPLTFANLFQQFIKYVSKQPDTLGVADVIQNFIKQIITHG